MIFFSLSFSSKDKEYVTFVRRIITVEMDALVKCHVHSVLFLYFDESSTPFTYYLPTSLKLSDKEPEPVSGDIGACNFFNKGTARGQRTASF